MAKTICEHSVNRFLNCSTARSYNMTVPPYKLQGIRNILSGLILKYFSPQNGRFQWLFCNFLKKAYIMSEHSLDPKGGTDRPVLLSCGPFIGTPRPTSNRDNIFQKLYLLEKISFKHFGKVIFVKCSHLLNCSNWW